MPRRRRPDHGRVAFELEEGPHPADAAPDDDPPGASADPGSPDGDTGSASPDAPRPTGAARRRGRRGALVAAAAAVVVVGGMIVVDAVSSRGSLETVRRAVGGVEPLPSAPAELWTVPAQTAGSPATLPGLVVLVRDDEAVAHDVDTGEVRWTVPLPPTSRCGGELVVSATAPVPDDELVCVTDDVPSPLEATTALTPLGDEPVPAAEGAEVTVIDAGGKAETRTLDAARGWSAPGPDGSVARFRRAGEAPDGPRVTVDPTTGVPSDLSAGRPAVVTLEDARTGQVRWEHELPFVPEEGSCAPYSDTESVTYADLDGATFVLGAGLVVVQGCGVDAWFTADGTRVDDPRATADVLSRIPDGALYRATPPGSAADGAASTGPPVVLEPEGEVRWEPPGTVLVPHATDGATGGLVLTREVTSLVARDATGARRWESAGVNGAESAYVVAAGTAVVRQGMGNVVVGVDVETGRVLWTRTAEVLAPPDPDGAPTPAPMSMVTQAFTDGARALLVVTTWSDDGEDTARLVALDLRDGDVEWRGDATTGSWYVAVQGRLLRADRGDATVTRLG
ncbi:outer membrane protein assembly factor BamB family protein [Cellulosimicrobium sp. CpK407]|uniref:outer membrane protein assembly factor BamB family protein n=1 Tax=Cellulosimicrobium sp. CpK407 TaxID=3229847 RepID=UPI003F3083A6